MPRRPRPASRTAPKTASKEKVPKAARPQKRKAPSPDPESSEEELGDESAGQEDSPDEDEDASEEEDPDADADAPRAVQWMDDEDSEEEEEPLAGPSKPSDLQTDLSSLSLGALRSAQRKIIQAEALEDSDDDSDGGDSESPEAVSTKEKQPEKPEWDAHPKKPIAHRAHKHAPQEVTSKRPVGRARTVVESHSVQPRDPRFVALTGEFSPEKFTQNYAFLSDSHKTELSTLRENLKRARKLVINSPKHLRAEREGEVSRLEHAVKRAESEVNKDRRLKVEREALSKLKKEEKDKREQGKGSWYMKDAEKKKFMIKARYDALADSGGQRAVKKAIEKKQKKIAQKEKKSRPFSASQQSQDKGWGGRDSKRRRLA